MFKLIDSVRINTIELAEQCLALANALASIEHPALNESLTFIPQEKQRVLLSLLGAGGGE
ncbi:hypothetical protein [Budvicia diplopodorum]|uniref:hypothetical protein n=1 Tax=Budvicia diplopodorum TaxID=1119056 RepID=UPI0013580647|nr:hypothetical protein [Budvicia diplopodorum]